MKRLLLILSTILILGGCGVSFNNTERLGRVDSTEIRAMTGKTVKTVYVDNSEYIIRVGVDIETGDLVYQTKYVPRNLAPPFIALCKHGFREGQASFDVENDGINRKSKNPRLCTRVK